MRILGVNGDMSPVVTPSEPPPAAGPAADAAPPAVAAATAAGAGTSTGTGTHDRRRQSPAPLPTFDPPLIAQRAALGLPTGRLIAELAEAEDMTYSAASAAVDRELPHPIAGPPAG
jgi:hypothetical protein